MKIILRKRAGGTLSVPVIDMYVEMVLRDRGLDPSKNLNTYYLARHTLQKEVIKNIPREDPRLLTALKLLRCAHYGVVNIPDGVAYTVHFLNGIEVARVGKRHYKYPMPDRSKKS